MSSSGKKRKPLVAERRYSATNPKATPKPKPKKKAATKAKRTKTTQKRKAAKQGNIVTRTIGGLLRFILRITWFIFSRTAVILGLAVAGGVTYYAVQLPPIEDLVDGRTRGSVTILDRNGDVFAWRGDQFGGMVTADSVSPNLKNAVIATEDKRFYGHIGVSPRGVASAVRINLRAGRGPLSGNGGSTLTQQTAKLLCMGRPHILAEQTEAEYEAECRRTTKWRKITEATYALAMELKYSKDDILTVYLNRAFLGAGARGFEAASQRYFGKSATQVTPAEAAVLAGLLKAPTRYAPTNNLQRSHDRGRVVIKLMEDQGYLTAAEADFARANPAQLSEAAQARAGGYFADWVMSSAPSFLTSDTTEDVIIQSTLDQGMQTDAEEALKHIFDTKVREGSEAQAAIVVMSADGAVRAMVGGRATKVSGAFNRATQANRQTGSSFKPFVFATALELGYTYADTIFDGPLTINIPGSGDYSPRNYTGEFYGDVTLTEALKRSMNTAAVRLSEAVGRDLVRKVANDFGIKSDLAAGPALALGVSESTLVEMTGAYAGILNGGRSVTPYGLVELRLQGDSDPMFGQEGGMGERVISQAAAEQLIYMMNQVVEGGSGARAKLDDRDVAGKTGTTQAARDAWFIGFSADYVTGVWMGYDDNTPLKGVTGGGLPADIWHETMTRIHKDVPVSPLPMTLPVIAPVAPPVAPEPQKKADPIGDLLRGIFSGGN